MAELSPEMQQALEAAVQLATQRHQAGDIAAAEALYGRVLTADSRHAAALHNLGLIRLSQGDIAAALVLLGAAAEERPDEAVFQFNLGLARQSAGDAAGSAAAYRQALHCRPDYRKAWENLGVVLQDQEQHDAAIDAYRHALQIDRCSPVAHRNLGNVLRATGNVQAATAQYREALDCNPLNAEVALQLGSTLLSEGQLTAWDWYEWRYWAADALESTQPYHVALPKWDGSSLDGRRLLLYGEQGVGDEIMFASCIPDVAALASGTALLCEPRLAPLFARSFPGMTVEAKLRGGLPPVLDPHNICDLRCSLASLPRHLRKTEGSFPGTAYLRADPAAVMRWRQRLTALGGRLTVGLSWRGGGASRAREARSIALERLAPLFSAADIRVVNVQYGAHGDEIARFNASVPHPLTSFDDVDPLRELDGFAALLTALDCIITVDNSTAHLAGALGVPTWLLLPFQADWRWQRGRKNTPWYHSLRLFWQHAPESEAWTGVVAQVRAQLDALTPRQPPSGVTQAVAAPAPMPVQWTAAPDVLLLNDTSYWYHWGCTGTSLAVHEALRAAGLAVDPVPITHINTLTPLPASTSGFDDDTLFQEFCTRNPGLVARLQNVATVVVNGEGSIHDLGQTARALLYLVYIAKQRFGKTTQIINHSCYPTADGSQSDALNALYRKVLHTVDFIALREEHSAAALAQLDVATVQSFDCLPLFIARHPPAARQRGAQRVVIAGSVLQTPGLVDWLAGLASHVHRQGYRVEVLVGANAWLAQDDVLLMGALHERLRGRYALVATHTEAEWLATIAGADLLISGRFHHSIAAACLGTPFLVTASNTSKIHGLLQRLNLAIQDVWLPPTDLARATAQIDAMLRDPQRGLVTARTLASLREMAARNFGTTRA